MSRAKPVRWVARKLVGDPHPFQTLHSSIAALEEKVDQGLADVRAGHADLTRKLAEHDARVLRAQSPRRSGDPDEESFEKVRGEIPPPL